VIYKISYDDCDASYVGQTKRQLKRICEYITDINNITDINKISKSSTIISYHRLKFNHNFKWDNVEIVDIEPAYKRLISEMVHIKKQKYGINKQNETNLLPKMYSNMIHSLSAS